MKKIKFAKGLLLPVLRGEKKITIRKFRKEAHDLIKEEAFIGVFEDGLNIILMTTEDTLVKLFSELTDKEARDDLYKDAKSAFKELKKNFYPELTPEDRMAIIRFEILKIDGTNVVESNEYAK